MNNAIIEVTVSKAVRDIEVNFTTGSGPAGLSAYQTAVLNGYVGTEGEWLASLKGDKGDTGADGADGTDGTNGSDGVSVTSVVQTTTSAADGGTNIITVTLSNGQTSTFNILNGTKGSKGDTGEASNWEKNW